MVTRRTTGSGRTTGATPPADKAAPRRTAPVQQPAAAASGASPGVTVSEDERRAMIARAAYLRAEQRGFTSGGEVEDWLAAEAEVDALLRARHSGPPQ